MEVECNRNPGASTNDSQLLGETDFFSCVPWLANPGNPATSPHVGEKKGIHQNGYDTQWKQRRVGWVEQPRNYAQTQNSPTINMRIHAHVTREHR